MSTTYFQRDTVVSVGSPPAPVLAQRLASQTAGSASANIATGNIAGGASTNVYFFTNSDDPGTDGSTGDYSVVLRFSVTNAQIQTSVALARVNSSGTVQGTETALSDEQSTNNSPLTFNFTAVDLGTWASGDRLRVRVQLRNQHGMNQACTLAVNTAADTIDTPFGEDEPEPAEGTFAVTDEVTVGWVGEAPATGGPTGLTATPVSTTQIDLEWDAYSGATGYDIEIDDVVVEQGVAGTTYEATGLDPDTEYKFRVGAVL